MVRENRAVGFVFGILGALLIALEGLWDIVRGIFFAAIGRPFLGLSAIYQAFLFLVLAVVIGIFVFMGRWGGRDRGLGAGVVLVVLAILGFFLLGFGAGILALLGGIFVLIAGILYIVEAR